MSKNFTLRKKIISCISALAFLGSATLSSNISWAMEPPPAAPAEQAPVMEENAYLQALGATQFVRPTMNNSNLISSALKAPGGPGKPKVLFVTPCGAVVDEKGLPVWISSAQDNDDTAQLLTSKQAGCFPLRCVTVQGHDGWYLWSQYFMGGGNFFAYMKAIAPSPLCRLTEDFPLCYVNSDTKEVFDSTGQKIVFYDTEDEQWLMNPQSAVPAEATNVTPVIVARPDLFGIPVKTPEAPVPPTPPGEEPETPKTPTQDEPKKKRSSWSPAKIAGVVGGTVGGMTLLGVGGYFTARAVRRSRTPERTTGTLAVTSNVSGIRQGAAVARQNVSKNVTQSNKNKNPRRTAKNMPTKTVRNGNTKKTQRNQLVKKLNTRTNQRGKV